MIIPDRGPAMSYALHHVLREVEWQSRFALSVADDLHDALAAGERFKAASAVRALLIRMQKVSELLWPGRERLSDRLLPDRAQSLRTALQIGAATPLTPDRIAPYYALFDHDLDEVQPSHGHFLRRPVLSAGARIFDLGELLAEIRRVWQKSSDLVIGD
jgi:hypothetical protein